MVIGKRVIDDNDVYIIVEEGQANQGDIQKAFKMIDAVSNTGADAIEFQFFYAEDFYISSHEGFQIYKGNELSNSELIDIADYVNSKDLDLVVAPLSTKIVDLMAENGCSAFNVNASDLITPDIIDAVSQTKLPFFFKFTFRK